MSSPGPSAIEVSDVQFEPFGEQVGKYALVATQTSLQTAVSRAGIGVFWTLVAGIVIARAIFFDPDFAHALVAHILTSVRVLFG